MFDEGWEGYDAAATLDAAVEYDVEENRAALGKLQSALHFADLHATLPLREAPGQRGGERLVVYGGDGCPAIAEFAPAEFGALLKMSSGAAAAYIGEALALRHRLPRIWAKTSNGQAVVWRARAVARACLKLTAEAAALVDERVVAIVDTVSAYRLHKIVEAVIKEADPEAARQAAEQRAREHGVWVQPSDDHGTKTIWVKAPTGDVIRFDATINDLAWALHTLGDPDPLPARRAKAIGWIADPEATYELLAAARYLATNPTTPRTDEPVDDPPRATAAEPPHDPTHAKQDPPGAAAAEPPHESTEAGQDPPQASATESPRDSVDAEQDVAGGFAAEPCEESVDAAEDLAGATAAEPPHDSAEAEQDLAGGFAAEPPYDYLATEPDLDYEAEPDAPHPSDGDQPRPAAYPSAATRAAIDPYSRHQLAGKLAAIKKAAHTPGHGPGRVILYAHLTDQTLLSGVGIVRVEDHGPLLVHQLKQLLGHDQVILKPVIDLNQAIDVNAYEIPTRIRERVKLTQPVERFPYSTTQTTPHTDLDHVQPYHPHGPPGQTSTTNLTPATRYHHRVKTHGRWTTQYTDQGALQWTTPNGFTFHVDHTGTHRTG